MKIVSGHQFVEQLIDILRYIVKACRVLTTIHRKAIPDIINFGKTPNLEIEIYKQRISTNKHKNTFGVSQFSGKGMSSIKAKREN